jgi:hypothetical protein
VRGICAISQISGTLYSNFCWLPCFRSSVLLAVWLEQVHPVTATH